MRLLLLAFVVLFAATVFAVSESITAPSEVTERAAPAAPARVVVKPVEAGETVAAQDQRPNPVVPLEAGAPPPVPVVEAQTLPAADVWDRLAACESSGRWQLEPDRYGQSGGIQIVLPTWRSYGGDEFAAEPYLASREEQIVVGERILAGQGWGAWPVCSKKIGVR